MTKNKVDAKRNEKRAKCDFMITKTLIPSLLQKCDPCEILPPAPAQFADSSPEEMNKVSDSKLLKNQSFLSEDFKHQSNIYQSKTTIVPGFRECG